MKICANCKADITHARCTGYSALYNPGSRKGIELCEPCFLNEDAAIDDKGTNNLPERLARYKANIGIS